MSRAEDEGMQGHAPWLADPVQSETPAGLLPVSARGKHEIEAAGGWVVACGAYDEYGCMPTEARDYIVATLNARAASQERPPIDVERRFTVEEWTDIFDAHCDSCMRNHRNPHQIRQCFASAAAEYARLSTDTREEPTDGA